VSPSTPPDIPGLVYVQPLGSGGYADVYLYEQQMPRMPVAVKVLKAEGMTPSVRRQFIDEADTMAQLADHPYIVQVFRSDTSGDGRPYLVMKYYPPPNLAARARSERFTVEEVLRTGIQLASAVETAHRAGVIHRDIKPANVLVSQYGAPGLTDFGIAGRGRALEEDTDDEVGVSVPWAPPEVLFGHSNGGPRSDIYSLSATLWQLLVGRSPFEMPGGDNSAYALMPRIRSTPVPSTGRADVPASLERLLSQAMAKDENARPETALNLARALQEIEQEQRFARTAIVVLDEQGHTTVADQVRPAVDDADQTRVRAPQAVHGQRAGTATGSRMPSYAPAPLGGGTTIPASSSPPVHTAPKEPAPVGRVATDVEEGTVRVQRDRPGTAGGTDPAGGGSGDGSVTISPVVLLGIIGLLVIGLVVGAIAVFHGGGDSPDPALTSPSTRNAATDGDQLGLPGVPVVKARSGIGEVSFTWSYTGAASGDTFRYKAGSDPSKLGDATVAISSKQMVTIKAPKGGLVCAMVLVNRSGSTTAYSDPACERAR